MEWIQERMGLVEMDIAFTDNCWSFAVKESKKRKKLRLWLLGDVGSWDFFSPPWEGKMGGVAACMYILRGDAPKMRTFIMQEEEGKL